MRRALCLLLCLALLPQLGGCALPLEDRREVEQLQVMQVMGLDYAPGGVALSLASASGREEAPLCLRAEGVSVSAAMDRLRVDAMQEEIFCGHVRQLLIGEQAAQQGLDPLLNYVARSPDLRLDMPVYVIRGTDAGELMARAGDEKTGIDHILQTAETQLNRRGESGYFTAAQLIRNLERRGSSLICALVFRDASQEDAKTASLSGLGIVKDGKLLRFLDEDSAVGARFLTNTLARETLSVHDLDGKLVSLLLQDGGTRLRPLWREDGSLLGLELQVSVKASLLEAPERGDSSGEAYADYLTAQLETAVSERIGSVLQLSKQLKTDFLGLADRVELSSPRQYRALEQDFDSLLPGLEISLSVRGTLLHGNDME